MSMEITLSKLIDCGSYEAYLGPCKSREREMSNRHHGFIPLFSGGWKSCDQLQYVLVIQDCELKQILSPLICFSWSILSQPHGGKKQTRSLTINVEEATEGKK